MVSAESFWQFSLQVYANKQVKALCLELQDDFSLNVNVLLLCGYLDTLQLGINPNQFARLQTSVADIEQNIHTLRQQRRALKESAPTQYHVFLKQELLLEQQFQKNLIHSLQCMSLEKTRESNFNGYVLSTGQSTDRELVQRVINLRNAIEKHLES